MSSTLSSCPAPRATSALTIESSSYASATAL
jgi:hypothetical protein